MADSSEGELPAASIEPGKGFATSPFSSSHFGPCLTPSLSSSLHHIHQILTGIACVAITTAMSHLMPFVKDGSPLFFTCKSFSHAIEKDPMLRYMVVGPMRWQIVRNEARRRRPKPDEFAIPPKAFILLVSALLPARSQVEGKAVWLLHTYVERVLLSHIGQARQIAIQCNRRDPGACLYQDSDEEEEEEGVAHNVGLGIYASDFKMAMKIMHYPASPPTVHPTPKMHLVVQNFWQTMELRLYQLAVRAHSKKKSKKGYPLNGTMYHCNYPMLSFALSRIRYCYYRLSSSSS